MNYKNRPEELEARQKEELPIIRLCRWTAKFQAQNGRLFVIANPYNSALLKHPEFTPIYDIPGTQRRIAHVCAQGMKKTIFVSNSSRILDEVCEAPCKAPQKGTLEDKKKLSQEPSLLFAHRFCTGLQAEALVLDSRRFAFSNTSTSTRNAYPSEAHTLAVGTQDNTGQFPDIVRDEKTWRKLLEDVADLMQNQSAPSWTVFEGHPIRARVAAYVPWQLERVQVYKTPKQRRMPTDIPYTLRATIGLCSDDSIIIEAEPIGGVAFPKQRFSKAVSVAVFVYGNPMNETKAEPCPPPAGPVSSSHKETENETQDWAPPIRPKGSRHSDEIWFEGVDDSNCPRAIRSSVARMHVNFSHMPKQDMLKLLSSQGAKQSVLSACNALRCAVCDRSKRPKSAHPSQPPRLGQFCDRIMIDIFQVALTDGKNYKLLGIIDLATLYHQVAHIGSRKPSEVFDIFSVTWLKPFGIPWTVIADLDGGFQGDFIDKLSEKGIVVDYIPPDAHWQLGTVERHNHVWREMANKVIDSTGAMTVEQLEMVILGVTDTKNNQYRRNGRSPMQAVFGRSLRLPEELLTDESIRLTFPELTLSEQQRFAELTRCEALKAFAEFETTEHIKKSMQRQTRDTSYDYFPGQRVGFWRSQTRRGAKRVAGGVTTRPKYLIGIFLGRQPPEKGNNLFIQYQGKQYLAAPENVRPAIGFENYTPNEEGPEPSKRSRAGFWKRYETRNRFRASAWTGRILAGGST